MAIIVFNGFSQEVIYDGQYESVWLIDEFTPD